MVTPNELRIRMMPSVSSKTFNIDYLTGLIIVCQLRGEQASMNQPNFSLDTGGDGVRFYRAKLGASASRLGYVLPQVMLILADASFQA
jgi:hypothetical protein